MPKHIFHGGPAAVRRAAVIAQRQAARSRGQGVGPFSDLSLNVAERVFSPCPFSQILTTPRAPLAMSRSSPRTASASLRSASAPAAGKHSGPPPTAPPAYPGGGGAGQLPCPPLQHMQSHGNSDLAQQGGALVQMIRAIAEAGAGHASPRSARGGGGADDGPAPTSPRAPPAALPWCEHSPLARQSSALRAA